MSQQEVMDILKKTDRWMTCVEVQKIAGTARPAINRALKKLGDMAEVLRRPQKNVQRRVRFEYRSK